MVEDIVLLLLLAVVVILVVQQQASRDLTFHEDYLSTWTCDFSQKIEMSSKMIEKKHFPNNDRILKSFGRFFVFCILLLILRLWNNSKDEVNDLSVLVKL